MSDGLPRGFGPYVLLETIGSGGAGSAYLAITREGPPSPLVIKRLHERYAQDTGFSARLRHEAAIAVSVDSPHVVRVMDVGTVRGEPFIAMERVPGGTIAQLMSSLFEHEEQLEVATAVALVHDALAGITAVHEALHPETGEPLGAIHRDISPKNLLVAPDGRVVVIDLGLGKSVLRDWATQTGALLGTPGYISPEAVAGGLVDQRADLYSSAVILFELLTVQHYVRRAEPMKMFEECMMGAFRPPSALRRDIPVAFDALLSRALAVDPNERFATAAEMSAALADALGTAVPPPGARVLPASFVAEVTDAERQIARVVLSGGDEEAAYAPTEIWARRTVTTPGAATEQSIVLTPTVPRPPPSLPALPVRTRVSPEIKVAIGSAVLGALFVGVISSYIGSTRARELPTMVRIPSEKKEEARVEPVVAPQQVEARPLPNEVAQRPLEVERPAPEPRPAKARVPAPKPKNDAPAEEIAEPAADFEALAQQAAALKLRRPDLAGAIDPVLIDVTMWRKSEPSARSRAAYLRLRGELDALAKRPAEAR